MSVVWKQITDYHAYHKGRKMNQIEIVADFENLDKAGRRVCTCNVGKISTSKYKLHSLEGIDRLQKLLLSRKYTMESYIAFRVTYPKPREVQACAFRDKIVQYSLTKNVLFPIANKHLIADNYASREGMGTLYAVNKFKDKLFNYYQHYGNEGYILKIDVKKFFYSINHTILKEQMRNYKFDDSVLWLIDLIIDSICHEVRNGVEYGVPIGNQTSQFFAVQYINKIDHFIKDQLGIKYYGRYMDDSYILLNSKQQLHEIKSLVTEEYNKLDLKLNGKTQIQPIRNGITFLGKRFSISSTGKITDRLCSRNIQHRYKAIRQNRQRVSNDEMTEKEYWASFAAWNGYAKHSDTFKIRKRLYDYAKEELSKC